MTPWEGKRTLTVVTACTSADGTPDFAINEVEVTHDEYENGVHYDLVEDRLTDDRYEEPWVHFDVFDSPAFLIPAVKQYLAAADDDDDDDDDAPEPIIMEKADATRPV